MLFRPDIQILRGFSVFIVFLYHLQIKGFENGYLGVDIFFVLSGYLMAQLYNQGSAYDFYIRRLKRLLPAYIVVIAITTLVVALITIPSDANQRFERMWFDLAGMSNLAFWAENSYFDSAAFKPLLNLWSLGVELQYYLLVPLVLPFLHKRSWALYLMIIASMTAAFFVTTISPKTSFFMMPFRVWEFLFGATVAWHFSGTPSKNRNLKTSLLLFAALMSIIFFYPLKDDSLTIWFGHPGFAAFLISLFTSIILIEPLHEVFSDKNPIGRSFGKIGDYSYSIYLVHFPIIVLVNYQIFGGTNLGINNLIGLFLIGLVTLISSYLLFNYVETIRSHKKFKTLFSLITFLCVIILLFSPQINQNRFTAKENLIFDAWSDKDTYRCGKLMRILSPAETICEIGSVNNAKKVFLLGNSHADSIKKVFSNSMDINNLSTFFFVANNPLMIPRYSSSSILNDINRLDISYVVIHFSPEFYTGKAYVAELEEFIIKLDEDEIPFALIAPVPTFEFNVPKALYEINLKTDTYSQSQDLASPKNLNPYFFDFINGNSLITKDNTFYPYDYLCKKNNKCLMILDGKPLYYDKDHLSLTGSNELKMLFKKIVNEINKYD